MRLRSPAPEKYWECLRNAFAGGRPRVNNVCAQKVSDAFGKSAVARFKSPIFNLRTKHISRINRPQLFQVRDPNIRFCNVRHAGCHVRENPRNVPLTNAIFAKKPSAISANIGSNEYTTTRTRGGSTLDTIIGVVRPRGA